MTKQETRIEGFLVAHGGPFYELQRRFGLLHERAFRAPARATLFVTLTWGVPLVLCGVEGTAVGSIAEKPYLLATGAWSRFFIAVALFILMERQVEEQLRRSLRQLVRAPLLTPRSLEPAARAVDRALRRLDATLAEAVCLALALLCTFASVLHLFDATTPSWFVRIDPSGATLSLAGWWIVAVSSPVFWFLLLRWLWRHVVWALLLRDLAALELRLVATHPDGHGGLGFIGRYPNAYVSFVLAVSCVMASGLAQEMLAGDLSPAIYGHVMMGWLLVVLAVFAVPLLAFYRPLSELKERTLRAAGAQATQYHRNLERGLLGRNITADDDEAASHGDASDPSTLFADASKLSAILISRQALLPISAAALLPLFVAGATQLPLGELLGALRRLLLF